MTKSLIAVAIMLTAVFSIPSLGYGQDSQTEFTEQDKRGVAFAESDAQQAIKEGKIYIISGGEGNEPIVSGEDLEAVKGIPTKSIGCTDDFEYAKKFNGTTIKYLKQERIDSLISQLEQEHIALVWRKDGVEEPEITEPEVELLKLGPTIIPRLLESQKRDKFASRYTYVAVNRMITSFGEKAKPYLLDALKRLDASVKTSNLTDKEYDYVSSIFVCLRSCGVKPDKELKDLVKKFSDNPSAKELLDQWNKQ